MRQMHIHSKLSLIVGALLLPLIVFGALYVRDGVQRIGQLDRALEGLAAAQASWEIADALARDQAVPDDIAARRANLDQLLSEAAQGDAGKRWDVVSDQSASPTERAQAAAALIATATRSSELSSASPSDVYVLSGWLSDELPLVLLRTRRLTDTTARLARRESLGPRDRMAFLVGAGQYKGIADVVSQRTRLELDSLTARDHERLEPLAAAFRKANLAFQKVMAANAKAVNTSSTGADLEAEALAAAGAEMIAATADLWRGGAAVVSARLMEERQNAFWGAVAAGALVSVILLVTLVAAVLMRRSILRGIADLKCAILGLADKEIDAKIAAAERSDELGQIAQAVGYFRDSTVARITASEQDQKAREEAKRREIMGELDRGFGDVVVAAADGDFCRQASADFEDDALNRLAGRLNELVSIFESGLAETSEVMGKLAQADLSSHMERQTSGAFLQLQQDVNAVVDSFCDIVGELKTASTKLRDASGDITASSEELARRIAEQRDAATRTSGIVSTVVEAALASAETAHNAHTGVSEARAAVSDGRVAMGEANDGMERIRSSADKIYEIIGLIEDIAMQTNMLAINASVEASRAGNAGKGFAVVAEEVRSLAQSTSTASEDVKKLVNGAIEEISEGAASVNTASTKLERADQSIMDAAELMEAIAERNTGQAEDLGVLRDETQKADSSAQRCAEQVGKTKLAIDWTDEQIQNLDRLVARFTTGGADQPQSRNSGG